MQTIAFPQSRESKDEVSLYRSDNVKLAGNMHYITNSNTTNSLNAMPTTNNINIINSMNKLNSTGYNNLKSDGHGNVNGLKKTEAPLTKRHSETPIPKILTTMRQKNSVHDRE